MEERPGDAPLPKLLWSESAIRALIGPFLKTFSPNWSAPVRAITRYVLFELLAIFFISLTAMTALMIIVGVAKEAVQQGLGPGPIARLLPYILPDALRFAVPATMLLAVSSLFGRMSSSNEVVAMKSLGISPMVLLLPAWTLAFFVSLSAVWLNDVAVSWGRIGVQRVVIESVEQIVYGRLRTQKSYNNGQFSISVRDVVDRRLLNPTFTFYSDGESSRVVITAREAELRSNLEDQTLSVILVDSVITVGDSVAVTIPGVDERVIPLSAASNKGDLNRGPSSVALRDISSAVDEQKEIIDQLEQEMAADAAYDLFLGDFASLTDERWQDRTRQLDHARSRLYRLQTEPWRRWANGFSCLFFVLLGAPLAIHSRSANFFNNFAMVFLPVLLIYYPLLLYGVDRAKAGAVPPYTVWLGNAILMLIALWYIRKVVRH